MFYHTCLFHHQYYHYACHHMISSDSIVMVPYKEIQQSLPTRFAGVASYTEKSDMKWATCSVATVSAGVSYYS